MITGVSTWQTVTWILLALCILLCVALIALIFYQITRHNKYHCLDGDNHPSERTPIVQPAMGSGYMHDRKTSSPQMSSTPAAPYGESQQF
ncbi:hypothetical protein DICVIV_13256 [Dictyocaulus viviparus]|uniref:Uncharacterized protein n=1 Tax=Dictyocaulus viviparus TaxID=29172 RepID=A0A0D8XAW5_DICVI|nr:hypothetical protein DICVIV_13256 [Dictyocaulus viviparus]